MLRPGERFPGFELPAHDGSRVSSGELHGRRYLLYFYPRADTPGCTREACAFRDAWAELERSGVEVFGVSFDPPERNRAFAEQHQLPFRLLSDRDQRLAQQVGAKLLLLPLPRRISYLVGGDGTVLKAYPRVQPGRHAEEVLDDLRALDPKG